MKTPNRYTIIKIVFVLTLFLNSEFTYAQCGAINFASPDTIICAPQSARFTIQNLPAGASVFWDFGNGTLAGNTSPQRFYQDSGEYTVKLQVTLVNNAVCEVEKVAFIKVKPKPPINISWDIPAMCNGPQVVTFTDNSLNMARRDYLLDGVLYANVGKNYAYLFDSSEGPRSLFVFATDSFGCKNNKGYDTALTLYWGLDSLGWDISFLPTNLTCAPGRLSLRRSINNLANHQFTEFKWEIQNANPAVSFASQPNNIILPEGTHSVLHTITNSDGCTYAIEKEDSITVFDSINPIVTADKSVICAGETVRFTLANFPHGKGRATWSFPQTNAAILSQNDSVLVARLNQLGNHGPSVRYTNNTCIVQKAFNNLVTVNGPNADFELPLTKTCTVPFDFIAYNTTDSFGAGTTQYQWSVINQKTNQTIFSSTFKDSILFSINDTANYTVKLKVSGSNGCVDSLVLLNAVEMDSLVPDFSINPYPACPGQNITLKGLAIQAGSSKNTYNWEVIDKDRQSVLFSKDNDTLFTFMLPDTGFYGVKLQVENTEGCRGTKYFYDSVPVVLPEISFLISNNLPCKGEEIEIEAVLDRQLYPNYTTRWIFTHKDSSHIQIFRNGDKAILGFGRPGEYLVQFVYRSANNQCIDTINATQSVMVSGMRMAITTTDSLFGCEPLQVNWNANVRENYNFINNAPNIYEWKAQRGREAFTDFDPQNTLNTTATYKQKGLLQSRLVTTHGSGCHDSAYTPQFTVGSTASFGFGSTIRCVNTTTTLQNYSLNATSFLWEVDDPTALQITPSDTLATPQVTVLKEGIFYITLYAIGPQGCRDTSRRMVRVINPKPDFVSSDTVQFCAPVVVTFKPTPVIGGVEYIWYFGDGDTLVTLNAATVSHVYKRNTDTLGIPVKLVVRNQACIDSTVKPNYVKVIGPVASYSFTVNNACEPMVVDFKNTSNFYSQFYLDYGDGYVLDSSDFDAHPYIVQDKAFNVQCYKSKLILVDDNNCYDAYESPIEHCVRKSAEADFQVFDSIGCERFAATFTNKSAFAVSFKWDYEGNGNFVNAPGFNSQFAYDAGTYNPRLVAFNANGCSDTTVLKTATIIAHPKPKSNFEPVSDSICFNAPLQFLANPTSDNKIIAYAWDFGDPANNSDTSSKQNPSYNYLSTLNKLATLVVTDSNSCKDTFGRFVFVLDTIAPVNPGFNYVTVKDDKDILLNWHESKAGAFDKYAVFLDQAGFTQLFETKNIRDTQFLVNTNIDVSQRRYCYTLQVGDTCGILSKNNKAHCTIFTRVEKAGNSRLRVSWVNYVGWDAADFWGYIVYRSDDNGTTFKPIDTLDNREDAYVDMNLCDQVYCYFVEAVHVNRDFRSRSNSACEKTDYVYVTDELVTRNASVLHNKDIVVSWVPYQAMDNLSHYTIDRFNYASGVWSINFDTSQSTTYIDSRADVNKGAYGYQMSPVDLCAYKAPRSNELKSIHLTQQTRNYITTLNWNHFKTWNDGILHYVIEFRLDNEQFNPIKIANSTDSSFVFEEINLNEEQAFCFRVYAVRNNLLDTAYANEVCVIPESRIYLPSAFSPNGDGMNDVFKPSAIFIYNQSAESLYNYQMEIFDRWGNKQFESANLHEGWDGVANGRKAPAGVYLYKVKAVGLDGEIFDFKGTLHLIR